MPISRWECTLADKPPSAGLIWVIVQYDNTGAYLGHVAYCFDKTVAETICTDHNRIIL